MNNNIKTNPEGSRLIVPCDTLDYKLKMLETNRIPGLLPLEIREEDGNKMLYYDISSRESFSGIASSRTLQMEDIRTLIFSFNRILRNIDSYLLDADDLILDKEHIYVAGDKLEPVLCYCPGYGENFSAGLSSLLQDLLGMVDSNDHQAVVATYALYQTSIKPGCTIQDLIAVLTGSETGNEQKSTIKETIRYTENGLKIKSITGIEDPRPKAVEDMDEFYEALGDAEYQKRAAQHAGKQQSRTQPVPEKNKHKIGIKFRR